MMFRMTAAYVLINAEPGAREELLEKLMCLEDLREIYSTVGTWDFVVKVEAETLERVKETVALKLRKLDNVKSSMTMLVFEK